jgi:hypothetical protein
MLQKIDAAGTDVAQILARHVVVHGGLYNRVHLSLGEDAPLGMDAEVLNLNAKKQVVAKMTQARFDAARYNIISATGINPPNLQGLWGSSWTPPWSSDFTQDGNLPTAISSYLMANTPELMQSFFAYQSRMMADYRINAKRLYGARGIYVPGHTGGYTGKCLHYDKEWTLSYWTAGAAWTADFYNDYWLYTGDKDFLKTVGYPYMKEAALFYEDFLIRGKDGKFMFIPSYSPENTPLGGNSQVCINATMDVMASKQLLRNCLAAGKLLGEDAKQLAKWQQILSDLPAYQINPKGELREWLWPGLADNHEHRHASHLYGLWGVVDPEIANSSTLTEATKRTFEQRMKIRARDNGGVMVFGMVNQAWTAAAVHDREATAEIIEWLSSRYWSNSMCSFHDPEGLFNMDLSGGFQSVVIRTLAYSETGKIELFPALPAKWTKGEISGILLRGQISLSKLSWEKGEVSATISSAKSQKIVFTCPILKAELKMNGKTIKPNKQHEFVLTLVENKNYSLQFGID